MQSGFSNTIIIYNWLSINYGIYNPSFIMITDGKMILCNSEGESLVQFECDLNFFELELLVNLLRESFMEFPFALLHEKQLLYSYSLEVSAYNLYLVLREFNKGRDGNTRMTNEDLKVLKSMMEDANPDFVNGFRIVLESDKKSYSLIPTSLPYQSLGIRAFERLNKVIN